MTKPTLLILAAGMGSRYGGLKQVDGVGPNDEAILEYSVFDAIRAGFGKVVFVIRKSFEAAFVEKFSDKFSDKIEIAYAYQAVNPVIEGVDNLPEREKPWGTGHAVLSAAHLINEPFAVINADDYYGVSAYATIASFFQSNVSPSEYAMVGFVLEKTLSDNGTVNRGICQTNEKNHLTDVVERLKIRRASDGNIYYTDEHDGKDYPLRNDDITSMNFWGFHPNFMQEAQALFLDFVKTNRDNPKAEFYIPLIVNHLIQAGKINLSVLKSEDQWFGVTYREDKPIVVETLNTLHISGVYPSKLW